MRQATGARLRVLFRDYYRFVGCPSHPAHSRIQPMEMPFVGIWSRPDPDNDWVYFVSAPSCGLVKIGFADNVERRLKEIRSNSPVPLEFLAKFRGGKQAERDLHKAYAAHRKHAEWFEYTAELQGFVHFLLEIERVYPLIGVAGGTQELRNFFAAFEANLKRTRKPEGAC